MPPRTSQTTGEMPNQLGAPAFGWIQPQTPDLRTPKTISAEAERGQDTAPTRSSFGRSSGTESCDLRARKRITPGQKHLACEHPAPGEVRGREAADQRPDRNGDRARRGDHPVGGGPALLGEVRGDERDDRRQDQRRADALEERPAEQEHGQARREGSRQRAARVDDAADRERALATDQGCRSWRPVSISAAITSV